MSYSFSLAKRTLSLVIKGYVCVQHVLLIKDVYVQSSHHLDSSASVVFTTNTATTDRTLTMHFLSLLPIYLFSIGCCSHASHNFLTSHFRAAGNRRDGSGQAGHNPNRLHHHEIYGRAGRIATMMKQGTAKRTAICFLLPFW